jgi:hypothetical protein
MDKMTDYNHPHLSDEELDTLNNSYKMQDTERLKFYKSSNKVWLYADSPTTRRKYRIRFMWATDRWVAYVRHGWSHEEVGYSDDLTGVEELCNLHLSQSNSK